MTPCSLVGKMLPVKTIGFLGISPILQCSACRFAPLFSPQDLRPQCFYLNGSTGHDLRSLGRASSTASCSRPSSPSASPHGYHYKIGAAYSAKGRPFNPKNDLYSFDPSQSTTPGKNYFTGRPNSGQDAFFVSKIGNGSNVAFGVADGVGGWADSGIDSAHFSHGLCEQMTAVARDTEAGAEGKLRPRELVQKGYDRVVTDRSISGGGSTACIAVGRNDGRLEVAKQGPLTATSASRWLTPLSASGILALLNFGSTLSTTTRIHRHTPSTHRISYP